MSKYRAYPVYKDSGVEWLGEVPEHWQVKRLKFLAQISNGQDQKQVIDDNGCYPIYGSGGIFGRANEYLYNEPSVLLGRKGTIDKPLFVTEPFWTVDTMYYTKIYPITFPKFFFYQCLTIQFAMYQYGSALPSMTQESLNGVLFSTPEYEEQQQIAAFLDNKTAHLDSLIEKKQQMIGLLNEKRIALITQAVTKGLDLSVPMKDSGVKWLGNVPEHWKLLPLKAFLKEISGSIKTGPFGSQLKASDMSKDGIKVYNQKNVISSDFSSGFDFISEEKYNELSAFEIFPEDLLITTRGTIGRCIIFPLGLEKGVLHPCLMRLQFKQNILLNKFFVKLMQETKILLEQLTLKSNATTIEVIYTETLKNLILAVPPVYEQQKIVDYLNRETEKIDRMINTVQSAIAKLQEYRTALITAAVTGKIDVRLQSNPSAIDAFRGKGKGNGSTTTRLLADRHD